MIAKSVAGILAALSALGAGLTASVAAPPESLVTIDRPGLWTLERLGYGPLDFSERLDRSFQQQHVLYRLPDGVFQGPGHWYTIRLHFRLVLRSDAGPGTVSVSAATNDRACALVVFKVERDSSGRPVVNENSLGEIEGRVVRRTRSMVREVTFENFLQTRGVRPGVNRLTFEINQNAIPMWKALTIFSDSGIEQSQRGPTDLDLSVHIPDSSVVEGETFDVRFRLRNRGRTARNVRVDTTFPADALRAVGPTSRILPWLRSDRPRAGKFRLRALRSGTARIRLVAAAGLSRAGVETGVHVKAADKRDLLPIVVSAGCGATALLVALGIAIRRKRR